MLNLRTLVALALSLFVSATSLAATLTVTTTADSGPGSLREALALANDGDVIDFSVTGTITLTSGQLVVGDSVTIRGPGRELLTISGNHTSRVIEILVGKQVAISGLTIANGWMESYEPQGTCCSGLGGAGICNSGNLALTDIGISGNIGIGWNVGAGICNDGDLTSRGLELIENVVSEGDSGAALVNYGSVSIANSVINNNGGSAHDGAYIRNEGVLRIADTQITENCCTIDNYGDATVLRTVVSGVYGETEAGIYNRAGAELLMVDTELSECSSYYFGGLVNHETGTVTLIRTLIAGNDGGYLGNIYNDGVLSLINSTVSDNYCGWDSPGIISNFGTLNLAHTTVAANRSYFCGPPIYNSGLLEVAGSVLSGSFDWYGELTPACKNIGSIVSSGNNIDRDGSCDLTGFGDITGDPLLGPLADNGGPTLTMALLPGSPAIDAVPVERCTDADGAPLLVDQRGIPRPQGAACDIGAFELEAIPVEIDIRPGSDLNPVNSVSRGIIPVAILGSDGFDVWNVDTQTLTFGPAGAEPRHDLLDLQTFENHLEDVNEDGLVDLVSHYRAADTGIEPGDGDACVTGRTLEGIPFDGCDSIKAFAGRRRMRR